MNHFLRTFQECNHLSVPWSCSKLLTQGSIPQESHEAGSWDQPHIPHLEGLVSILGMLLRSPCKSESVK